MSSLADPPGGADVLTVAQLAARLQLSEHGTRNAIERGEIPGVVRIGRRIRISRSAVERWLGDADEAPRAGPCRPVQAPDLRKCTAPEGAEQGVEYNGATL